MNSALVSRPSPSASKMPHKTSSTSEFSYTNCYNNASAATCGMCKLIERHLCRMEEIEAHRYARDGSDSAHKLLAFDALFTIQGVYLRRGQASPASFKYKKRRLTTKHMKFHGCRSGNVTCTALLIADICPSTSKS